MAAIPSGARFVPCRGKTCNAEITWVGTMPLNRDGTPHWATCPDRKQFSATAQSKDEQESQLGLGLDEERSQSELLRRHER